MKKMYKLFTEKHASTQILHVFGGANKIVKSKTMRLKSEKLSWCTRLPRNRKIMNSIVGSAKNVNLVIRF